MSDSKRWISAQVSGRVHEALRHLATKKGLHTSEVAARLIAKGLAREADADKGDTQLRLYALAHRAEEDRITEQQLERIAWLAMKKNDEALADELQELCSETGYDPNEIIQRASNFKQAPMVVGHNKTSKEAAMRWLQERFNEQEEWPVTKIRDELGDRAGFSQVTLNRAKRDLGIISERRSNYWVWALPEEEQLQQQPPYRG